MTLRPGATRDVDFILDQEARKEFQDFIVPSTRDEHARYLADPDYRYLIFEDDGGARRGYAMLRGLSSPHRGVELKRIVMAEPGRGHGKRAMRGLLRAVFEDEGAHRFWLMVFADNARARHVYRGLGFTEEGILRDVAIRGGAFRSAAVMSMLAGEYFAATGNGAPARP